eukprot:snap_masked-scaffold_20-processed-gene-0.24-mRNA-1 protein AED:1.00 eAED:1.00 QI:0/-1/0/0/-1/1/1/0/303
MLSTKEAFDILYKLKCFPSNLEFPLRKNFSPVNTLIPTFFVAVDFEKLEQNKNFMYNDSVKDSIVEINFDEPSYEDLEVIWFELNQQFLGVTSATLKSADGNITGKAFGLVNYSIRGGPINRENIRKFLSKDVPFLVSLHIIEAGKCSTSTDQKLNSSVCVNKKQNKTKRKFPDNRKSYDSNGSILWKKKKREVCSEEVNFISEGLVRYKKLVKFLQKNKEQTGVKVVRKMLEHFEEIAQEEKSMDSALTLEGCAGLRKTGSSLNKQVNLNKNVEVTSQKRMMEFSSLKYVETSPPENKTINA